MLPSHERIVSTAFQLFADRGFDQTSVDEIAAAAGVSRSTFFRYYGSKEAVIFPDHDSLLAAVEDRLKASTHDSAIKAVSDAVRLVLFHYVAEGDRARQRYWLTRRVPALRERELVSGARYQRLFGTYIASWGDGSDVANLKAELVAAAVIAAHNRVLRRWLRAETTDPQVDIDTALSVVLTQFEAQPASIEPSAIVVLSSGVPLSQVVEELSAGGHVTPTVTSNP